MDIDQQGSGDRRQAAEWTAGNMDGTGNSRPQVELSAIYDYCPIMMCQINSHGNVVRFNHAMREYIGQAGRFREGMGPGDIIQCIGALGDARGCGFGIKCKTCAFRHTLMDTMQTGEPHRQIQCSIIVRKEKMPVEVFFSVSTARIYVEGENQVMVCMEDVTARKDMETKFHQMLKMETMGQLVGGVAHDFNNILSIMLIDAGQLEAAPDLTPESRALVEAVLKQALRARDLTRQLLLFSHSESMSFECVDLNESVKNLLKMLRRLMVENVPVLFNPGEGPMWIHADPTMMDQVIMNLCVNARDAMPKGGQIVLTTRLATIGPEEMDRFPGARMGDYVCVSVKDTGTGISDEVLKQIWEPFFTTKEKGKGTGLGLATVQNIVQRHHGWVRVETTLGIGTVFHVYIPYQPPDQAGAEKKSLEQTFGGAETILLVEDDDALRKSVALNLRNLGYRVCEAATGMEALHQWETLVGAVDLLFVDMVLPLGMSGLELAERLRMIRPELKIMVCSGYSLALEDKEEIQRGGMCYLSKPYSALHISRTIRRMLDGEAPPEME